MNYLYLFVGISGFVLLIWTAFARDSIAVRWSRIIGAIMLSVPAIADGAEKLIGSQVVVVAGGFVGLHDRASFTLRTIPVVVAIGVVVLLGARGELALNFQDCLMFVAFTALGMAFAIREMQKLGFMIAGSLIALWSGIEFFLGVELALLWCLLNIAFVVAARRGRQRELQLRAAQPTSPQARK